MLDPFFFSFRSRFLWLNLSEQLRLQTPRIIKHMLDETKCIAH